MSRSNAAIKHCRVKLPRCLQPFIVREVSLDRLFILQYLEPDTHGAFQIECPRCRSEVFAVIYTKDSNDPSGDEFEIGEGDMHREVLNPDGKLALKCKSCDIEQLLFDLCQHGYDGELGHFDGCVEYYCQSVVLDGDEAGYKIVVAIGFNSDLTELEAIAAQTGKRATDLFDDFSIVALSLDGRQATTFDFECA